MDFKDASPEIIDETLKKAWNAFHVYRKYSLKQRADFMREIAREIGALGDKLIETAARETNLKPLRLQSERARTIMQLNNYADETEKGSWLEIRIDTADPSRTPPKPDLRKMLVPLGPVVVFGASNFPFAYSTAGGDTACAFAAGCPVIVKAHPAHPETSAMVASAIDRAVQTCGLPDGLFSHVYGQSIEVGKALVTHPYTKAVGFTGSFQGGKSLFDWANQREEPIPVFSEMGSINPVFLFPGKLRESSRTIAEMYAPSITLGVGQFCTNPGLIVGVESRELDEFIVQLGELIRKTPPDRMLHPGIARSFRSKKNEMLEHDSVEQVAVSEVEPDEELMGAPVLASASGRAYLDNPVLHHEVFGPYSLVVKCRDMNEMLEVTKSTAGQLTCTLMATEDDVTSNIDLVDAMKNICGRLIYNNVPTGVEVCLAMHHGGPYPASTDSRFTSVGADGIKRFARPVSFQNWPDLLLPDELKENNPLKIWRTVNGNLEK